MPNIKPPLFELRAVISDVIDVISGEGNPSGNDVWDINDKDNWITIRKNLEKVEQFLEEIDNG